MADVPRSENPRPTQSVTGARGDAGARDAVAQGRAHIARVDEFHARFAGLCDVLIDDAKMFGYCYTQLTDVFQEQNGIYGFDRSVKFDMQRIRAAQSRIAAIEQQAPASAVGAATQRTAKAG